MSKRTETRFCMLLLTILLCMVTFLVTLTYRTHLPCELEKPVELPLPPIFFPSTAQNQTTPSPIVIFNDQQNNFFTLEKNELDIECSIPCKLVRGDGRVRARSDAVFFTLTWWDSSRVNKPVPSRDFPEQLYFGLSMEVPAYYSYLASQWFMNQFNVTFGYPFYDVETHVHFAFGPYPFRGEGENLPRGIQLLGCLPSSGGEKRTHLLVRV